MTMTLWGRVSSANVQKAIWALEEVGVEYSRIDKGGKFGGLDEPAYRALNPNGLIPTLQDGAVTVWESHAIVRYLSAQYASGLLWPVEPQDRALADQWTDWAAMTFQPAWIGVYANVVRLPKEQQSPEATAIALEKANRLYAILDAQLAMTPYVAGTGLTYADIVIGVSMYRWTTMEIARPELAHLDAWHKRLLARPAFVRAVNVSYEDQRGAGAPR